MKKNNPTVEFTEAEIKAIVQEYVEEHIGPVKKIKSKIKLIWSGKDGKDPDEFDGMIVTLE